MGLPYWLPAACPGIVYRTKDPCYLNHIASWYSILLPKLVPLLYENGGPIIIAQVENEYGSYWTVDDFYLVWLRDLIRKYLGPSLVLVTVDGDQDRLVQNGLIDQVYPTVDFGPLDNVRQAFQVQRHFAPNGPLVNMEFYPGWFDVWGEPHRTVEVGGVAQTLDKMLAMNASVNM